MDSGCQPWNVTRLDGSPETSTSKRSPAGPKVQAGSRSVSPAPGADPCPRVSSHTDGRIHLAVSELLREVEGLAQETLDRSPEWPFVLAAGERRSSSANTIYRDPD